MDCRFGALKQSKNAEVFAMLAAPATETHEGLIWLAAGRAGGRGMRMPCHQAAVRKASQAAIAGASDQSDWVSCKSRCASSFFLFRDTQRSTGTACSAECSVGPISPCWCSSGRSDASGQNEAVGAQEEDEQRRFQGFLWVQYTTTKVLGSAKSPRRIFTAVVKERAMTFRRRNISV